jgi:uncharacterized protein YndB with AHSA1/START domain
MTAKPLSIATPGDREIVITREFNAPRELVFDALAKAELLKRWFNGPPGWQLTVCEVDFRIGGRYRFVWRGPDGMEMGLGGVHKEIVRPERVVRTEVFDQDWTGGETLGTSVFTEKSGRTTLTTTVVYASREARDGALKSGMAEGMEAGYQSLDAFLVEHAATGA